MTILYNTDTEGFQQVSIKNWNYLQWKLNSLNCQLRLIYENFNGLPVKTFIHISCAWVDFCTWSFTSILLCSFQTFLEACLHHGTTLCGKGATSLHSGSLFFTRESQIFQGMLGKRFYSVAYLLKYTYDSNITCYLLPKHTFIHVSHTQAFYFVLCWTISHLKCIEVKNNDWSRIILISYSPCLKGTHFWVILK